ncbi:mandelate racemase/muconate lactonizing enzyme family protein, partial [Streptomyces sp. NPDC057543]
MSIITNATALLADIDVETDRTDAVQSFVKQETVLVTINTTDGLV